ncbi:MAG: ATP-binding protein [Chloroflexota bacterium]
MQGLEAQRQYVQKVQARKFDFSLMIADAFVRGIRDIGYRDTSTAIDELIDNSIQANAKNIHIVYNYPKRANKPSQIAIIDDGHGMEPEMIRLAIIWGGTHREGNREGFGRYGYGLPSASISQGQRFEVYSRVAGGGWYKGRLDVDELAGGVYTDKNGRVIVPKAAPTELPDWVAHQIQQQFGGELRQGTVILLDKLDRLTWKTQVGLTRNLLPHFGMTYRNFLFDVNIFVDGHLVQPIDPLFTTQTFRYYDLDEDRAEPLETLRFDVRDANSSASLGEITVRFAYFPVTFASRDKSRPAQYSNANQRFSVMKETLGIVVCRNGRQIDVVTKNPWTTFRNRDRYWGVEIDFPATMDEEFSITTSKQRVIMSDRIWQQLKQAGVLRAIQQMRNRWVRESEALKAESEVSGEKRPSENALQASEKFRPAPDNLPPEKKAQSNKRFEEEAFRRAQQTGRPFEEAKRDLEIEIQGRPYRVQFEPLPGAPFFHIEQVGGQRVLYLNTAHRFFTHLYSNSEAGPYTRAALEVLLFVLGECESEASGDRQLFYESERAEWSKRLNVALDRLGERL